MGLGDFLQNILGSKTTFQAQPMQLDKTDYTRAMNEAQKEAIASLNLGAGAGEMQKSLAQQLMEQSQGQAPSLAQMQLKEASEAALRNQIGAIASQRGMNPAQAARTAAMMGAQQQQTLAGQGAQLRLVEQAQKQQQLAQALQSQRQLDIAQQAENRGLMGTTGQLSAAQKQMELENYWNAQKINAGIAQANTQQANQLLGSIISGASSVGASAAGAAHGGEVGELIGPDEATPADYSGDPKFRTVAVSPGEKVVNSDGSVMKVPGKAEYKGDDPRNDTVIADLRRDSIVVPRTKSGDKQKMIEFLKHVKESSKKKSDLEELLNTHKEISDKLEELKYKMGKYRPK